MIIQEFKTIWQSFIRLIIKLCNLMDSRPRGEKITLLMINAIVGLATLAIGVKKVLEGTDPLWSFLKAVALIIPVFSVFYLFAWLGARIILGLLNTSGINESEIKQAVRNYDIGALTDGALTVSDNGIFKIHSPTFSTDLFSFADDETKSDITGIINSRAFKEGQSLWAGTIDQKRKRNAEHAKSNKYTLLLIQHPKTAPYNPEFQWLGFTHVIPVSKITWDLYLDQHISDNSFSADRICKENEPAYGLIIFTIAKDKNDFEDNLSRIGLTPDFSGLLLILKGLAYHIYKLAKLHFQKNEEFRFLIQTSDLWFKKFFEKNGLKVKATSADGCPIFVGYFKAE